LSEEDGQKVDWRDLLGDAKNFNPGVYGESEQKSEDGSDAMPNSEEEDDAVSE
jgi:hypothetical protein